MTNLPRIATLVVAVLCCREVAAQAQADNVPDPANEPSPTLPAPASPQEASVGPESQAQVGSDSPRGDAPSPVFPENGQQAQSAPPRYDSAKSPPQAEGSEPNAQPGSREHWKQDKRHWKRGKKGWKQDRGHWKQDKYRQGARTHDGFFFRWAFGFGGYQEWLRSDEVADVAGDLDAQIVGIGKVREVAMGGTFANGLVFGGGLFDVSVLAGSTKVDDDLSLPGDIAPIPRSITLIGPFIDWYPRRHAGFHVFGALGFAHMHSVGVDARPFESDSYDANGAALSLGLGYDWWVTDQWSLGAMGRMTVGGLVGKDEDDAEWGHAFATWPALMFAATYH